MSRLGVHLRPVREDDVAVLTDLWSDVLRRGDAGAQAGDVLRVVREATTAPGLRLVVAEAGDEVAGAILLRHGPLTPLNLEPVVEAVALQVFPRFRRRGIGRALLDAAVSWAEELGVGHVASGSLSGSRDGNRFLARLGLGAQLVLRVAPTPTVRAQLVSTRTPVRSSSRQRERVLASRRVLLRRERALG